MSGPFGVNYVVGVDNINLPSPYFPILTNNYEKGFRLDVQQGTETQSINLVTERDCHLKGISISATGYNDGDNWDLMIGEEMVYESIYMKELGESKSAFTYPSIPTGTIIQFNFHNTGPAKVVYFDLYFLQ